MPPDAWDARGCAAKRSSAATTYALPVPVQGAEDRLEALRELSRAVAEFDDLRRAKVAEARSAGASWDAVGEALGVTRQSAWALYSADIRARLAAAVAAADSDLSEDEALDIAVEEVRAVRRARRPR